MTGAAKSSFSRVGLGTKRKWRLCGYLWGRSLLKEEQKLSRISRRMLGQGCLLGVEDVTALFENVPVKGGRMDDEGEIAFYKLPDCYQLSRKEGHL